MFRRAESTAATAGGTAKVKEILREAAPAQSLTDEKYKAQQIFTTVDGKTPQSNVKVGSSGKAGRANTFGALDLDDEDDE